MGGMASTSERYLICQLKHSTQLIHPLATSFLIGKIIVLISKGHGKDQELRLAFGAQYYQYHLAVVVIKKVTVKCEYKPTFRGGLD